MKFLSTLAAAALLAVPASATTLRVTITNNQAASDNGSAGFAFTPVYTAFHNGQFDTYDLGSDVSAGVERIAELGDPSLLPAERTAPGVSPGSTAAVISNGRPLFGGESASAEVEITDFLSQRFFSFISMIVPSNDTFIANGDPLAFDLFNNDGSFAGPRTINVTGQHVRDAGTEANDASATGGAAFAAGAVGTEGVDTRGTTGVTDGFAGLADFLGVSTVAGFSIDPGVGASFFADQNNAAQFSIATITIEEVAAPVPLPAGGILVVSALGALSIFGRRKLKSS